jgi:excisionase family DNA binding protein
MIKNKDGYLTTDEIAVILGFSRAHVIRLIGCGKIKGTKLANNWLVKPKDIKNIKRVRNNKPKD